MTSLLLLVDLQRDYLSPDLEPAPGPVVRGASALLQGARGAGVPVAHVWTTVSRGDDRRMPHWRREDRWLCERGTPGHAPPPELEPEGDERVVHKTSFSAFENGELDRALSEAAVDRLIVAGVHLHGCVRQTVLDAYERRGLEIWVAEDATASDDPVHAAITRRYLERRAARFLTVAEILDRLAAGPAEPAGAETVEAAVHAACTRSRTALEGWRGAAPADRARLLTRLADRLEPKADGLAREMAIEIGKPVRYGSIEVRRAAEMLRAVARHGGQPHTSNGAQPHLRRPPLGLVAAITPWNNPVYIPLGKIAPAIVFGNAVLWKPAPAAQAISERVVRLVRDAGVPAGLVEMVAGGRRAAEAAMADPLVDAVTLTGSSLAGFGAQEICARRRIPLQAELGGNNAALVWPDADLANAAREIADGAFALAGQRCTANRRVVVHRDCAEPLMKLLRRETAAMEWGDPLDPATRIGPLIDAAARDRITELVARAGPSAGQPLVPHGRMRPANLEHHEPRDLPADRAFDWYPPTIVACDEPEHELVHEETFGPLLVVQTASDWDGAMRLVNGVRQGLAAALFSTSPDVRARFLDEAQAGILKLDRSTADAEVDVPFGGWKASGIGPPEHGSFDQHFYTRPQVVYG